jgi:hypothetical protein
MQTHRHTFFASIFTFLFAIMSVSYAQITTTSSGNSAAARASADGTVVPGTTYVNNEASTHGAWGNEDWSSVDFESSQFAENHPRMAKALKFLNNESYRAGIEANMGSEDKQTIEAAVTDAKSNLETLKGLRTQYKAARATHDSLALYQMEKSSRPNFDRLVTDRRTIIDIIAKYKFASPAATTTGSLLGPVYPNPVHLGESFNFSYDMKESGPVRIVVTDASGNTVKEIAFDTEAPGDNSQLHQFGSIFPAVGTYYITVESNGAKSTQKVDVIQ